MEFTLDFPGFGGSTAKKKAAPKKTAQKKAVRKKDVQMITNKDFTRFSKEIAARKPIGPFTLRQNAKGFAEKLGWKYFGFRDWSRHGVWAYYTIPPEMNENFEIVKKDDYL